MKIKTNRMQEAMSARKKNKLVDILTGIIEDSEAVEVFDTRLNRVTVDTVDGEQIEILLSGDNPEVKLSWKSDSSVEEDTAELASEIETVLDAVGDIDESIETVEEDCGTHQADITDESIDTSEYDDDVDPETGIIPQESLEEDADDLFNPNEHAIIVRYRDGSADTIEETVDMWELVVNDPDVVEIEDAQTGETIWTNEMGLYMPF